MAVSFADSATLEFHGVRHKWNIRAVAAFGWTCCLHGEAYFIFLISIKAAWPEKFLHIRGMWAVNIPVPIAIIFMVMVITSSLGGSGKAPERDKTATAKVKLGVFDKDPISAPMSCCVGMDILGEIEGSRLGTPRNSLELPMKTSQGLLCCRRQCAGELHESYVMNSYQVQQDWAGKNCHPTEASMKKLINQEMSKRSNTRHNTPSIVARLMGMDMLPLDTKSMECNSFHRNKDRDPDRSSRNQKLGKPRPREHPQEEELQKFKKELKHGKQPANEKPVELKVMTLKQGIMEEVDGNTDESWASSSGTLEERDSIEDFLEEVKERLKHELQGKPRKRVTLVRGGGIETPFSERPSEPKQIAQHIAKQVRESVTRDLGMNLLRSESTRSYRSEIQLNGSGSPEFINRDTRKFLSERLRNVLKRETHQDIPIVVNGSSRLSMLDYERNRLEQTGDNLKAGNRMNHWENVNNEAEMQTRSFRHGPDDDAVIHRESSPRNLIRSYQPQKIQSSVESCGIEHDPMKDIMSGPTVIMNLGDRHENSTEVPPSPASVCSSAHENSSDLPLLFVDYSELRRQLDQLGSNGSEDTTIDEEPPEVEMIELEDQAEAYIRDLLVASGFYGGSSDTVYQDGTHLQGLSATGSLTRFRRKFMGSTMLSAPHGKKLLDCVWEIIRVHVYPPADKSCYSLDSMVARDLGSIPWSGLIDDEMNALGRDMESMILECRQRETEGIQFLMVWLCMEAAACTG
ncbi:hypothetical protein CK203_080363 [Vitis vinifera]|uniref:DUF4378 domain-containing protein n=1 Tax=Vitis vinifera TaxID=29760 RepID=A0A438CNI5_VITVI|nr:hypothetical protein CK203_080363 [Vitis vinifera]